MSQEIFKKENVFTQHNLENKQFKEKNQKEKKEECEKVKKEENENVKKEENENVKKEENEKLIKEENEKLRNENEQLRKKNVAKDAIIKELIKIKSLEEDKNATSFPNWFDKNKFKNILAIINSNTFNYRHKICEFKYIDIKDLINKIKNNTISEISAKNDLNTLNEIKHAMTNKTKKTQA